MTTTTLRPNATTSSTGITVTGAASVHAALSDSSDASYIEATTAGTTQTARVGFGTVAMPAGSVTKQIRPSIRGQDVTPSQPPFSATFFWTPVDPIFVSYAGAALVTTTGASQPIMATQADIDQLYAEVVIGNYATDGDRAVDIWAELTYVVKPVTVVTPVAPDPETNSSVVSIAWANTLDSDGGGQTYYEVKVFNDAQYGAGGFSASTSDSYWTSGVVASSWTSTTTGVIPNDIYRVYVRVAQSVNGSKHWSAWAFDGFTVTVPAAEVDTVTMIVDNPNGSIEVTVTRAIIEAWDFLEVQRSFDAGVTWEYVRGAAYVDVTAIDVTFIVDDYEVGNAQSVKYRARATRTATGTQIVSPWVESASTTSWSSSDVWLKDPFDPSKNLTVCMRLTPSTEQQRRRGVFDVIGSAYPVVVSDVLSGITTEFEVQATTIADTAALLDLATSASVLLLQTPPTMPEGSRYLHVGGVGRSPYDPSRIRPRQWVALTGAVEVEAPADAGAGI